MRHGNGVRSERKSKKVGGNTKTPKSLPNNHEHLGSFIIKNTRYDQGITQILEEYGLDVQLISNIIKGDSRYQIANQLMHSDLDADRMDYLLRDSHYTGLKYGQFDRDYILANLVTYGLPDGQMAFGVRENAAHAVEDFLIARFSWYSQVIKSQSTAKFDILASQIAKNLLEQDLIYQFHDLLTMIEERDERFFWFNDIYFINRCFEIKEKKLLKDPKHTELTDMLLYRQAPKIVRHPLLQHRIIKNDKDGSERIRHVNQIIKLEQKFNQIIKVHGTGREWIFVDIPLKDVTFTKSPYSTKKLKTNSESVKIVSHRGVPELLVNRSNSLMKHLSEFNNFIPSAYANASAIQLLRKYKAI
jgi:HD superfamily phosphohydrolase